MKFALGDDDYYADRPVSHVAQGDLYANVPLVIAEQRAAPAPPQGARKRGMFGGAVARLGPQAVVDHVAELVVVCNYTCGFVAQPPGTHGYAHGHRLVAPVVPLGALTKAGMSKNDVRRVANSGHINGLLRLPPPPGWSPAGGWGDPEFEGHLAACLWKLSPVDQGVLDADRPVTRLSLKAQRMLVMGLIQVFSPYLFDPEDEDLQDPDMSDSWAPQA